MEDNRYDKLKNVNFLDDERFTTPLAVSNYVNANYLKSSEKTSLSIGTLASINVFDPNDIFSIGALSNLLFNDVILKDDSYTTFANNQVFSSKTMSNYVENFYINNSEKIGYTEDPESNKDKVIIGGSLSNYVRNTFYDSIQLSIFNPFSLSDFEDETYKFPTAKIVKNYVNYVINDSTSIQDKINVSLSNVSYSYATNRADSIENDNKYITPHAVSNYVNDNYLKVTNRRDYTVGQTTLANINNFDVNHIFSIGALSNLLFKEMILNNTLSLANNTVLSSETLNTYLDTNYVNVDKLEKTTDFLGEYYYDDTYIPTTATTSNIVNHILDMDRFSDKTTISDLTTDTSLLINEGRLKSILDNVVMRYEKHNHLDWADDGTYMQYNIAFTTNFTGLEEDLVNNIIPTVDLVKDLIDAKIDNVTMNIVDGNAVGGYSWSDRTALSNNKFLPTIGLMESTIDSKLTTGVSLNLADLVVDNFTINQQLTFYPYDSDRLEIESGKMFLTIDSNGHHMFKRVDTLSGSSAEVTEGDDYSMVTGTHTRTFGDNQLVCGTYNSSNNIYKQIGLSNASLTYDSISGYDNPVNFVVGTGSADTDSERANGFEVHNTGEVYVRSNLILGDMWRLSFDNETLSIEKREGDTYIQKHIFK
jgi:hypothetical protein